MIQSKTIEKTVFFLCNHFLCALFSFFEPFAPTKSLSLSLLRATFLLLCMHFLFRCSLHFHRVAHYLVLFSLFWRCNLYRIHAGTYLPRTNWNQHMISHFPDTNLIALGVVLVVVFVVFYSFSKQNRFATVFSMWFSFYLLNQLNKFKFCARHYPISTSTVLLFDRILTNSRSIKTLYQHSFVNINSHLELFAHVSFFVCHLLNNRFFFSLAENVLKHW